MAASISHMLIPLSKTDQANFRSRKVPTPPSYFNQNQKSTKLIAHNNNNNNSSSSSSSSSAASTADVWREIHGENGWSGLLDPMDPTLRRELIRYGEMAQACYEAFDFYRFSKFPDSCRFPRHDFFNSVDMCHHGGYTVTRYLYTTDLPSFFRLFSWSQIWSNKSKWAGYVAVSDDATSRRLGRRDVTVVWHGTVKNIKWVPYLMASQIPISSHIACPDQKVKVESGLVELYTNKDQNYKYSKYSAREQVLSEVKRLMEFYCHEELSITITGHSLGSALAILSAYDIAEMGLNVKRDNDVVPVSVISFSGHRVGNARFKERLEMLGVKVMRVVNVCDMVVRPPRVMKLLEDMLWNYSHVGMELALDHKNSPFLKPDVDSASAHNLEVLLHLIDGYHGKRQRFVLATGRDPALVNKDCDCLKTRYLVPPNWRQDENKAMIRGKDGRWVEPELPVLDDDPEDMLHHLKELGVALLELSCPGQGFVRRRGRIMVRSMSAGVALLELSCPGQGFVRRRGRRMVRSPRR